MIAYPAIDLRGGDVVQLVGGRPEAERVRLPDPVSVARRWVEAGFGALHVVDLDAALATDPSGGGRADPAGPLRPATSPRRVRTGPSALRARRPVELDPSASAGRDSAGAPVATARAVAEPIRCVLDAVDVPVQVGGGVRDDATAAALLDAGAARVVIGTRGVEEPGWLGALARKHPGRIVLAADVRGEHVVTRGWTATTELAIEAVLERVESLPLAGVLVTDVGREGRMSGIDAARFGALVKRTRHSIVASGGVAGLDDLHALAAEAVAGVVLGMALYTGAMDAALVAAAFAG